MEFLYLYYVVSRAAMFCISYLNYDLQRQSKPHVNNIHLFLAWFILAIPVLGDGIFLLGTLSQLKDQ